MNNWIKFVGTAGARFVVARQLRSSGGIWLSFSGTNLYLDPGPGALVHCWKNQLNPAQLDGILLSHKHLDHSGDLNAMIEAMTEGGYRPRGVLFAPQDALEGDPVVLRYVRSYLERIEILREETDYSLGQLKFSTGKRHIHPVETYGFNFALPCGKVSFLTDTKYHPDLAAQYPGDLLIMNVVLLTPIPNRRIDHLALEDVKRLLRETQAKVTVLTHFGLRVLEADPGELARRLSEQTGKRVIAAEDGLTLDVDEILVSCLGKKLNK